MLIEVNPKVLIWAREERGMSLDAAAVKLKIDVSNLLEWENGVAPISFSVLEDISRLYKRQSAIFFLDQVPEKIKKPRDYRNLAAETDFSPEAMLAVRRTERYLKVARELSGADYWNNQYSWIKRFTGKSSDADKEVALIKEILGLKITGDSAKKPEILFRELRVKFEEKLGIFVFQFPMPSNEFDGFSYAFDEFPYAIAVNNQNSPVKKIFTLFHELAHILRHDPSLCKNDFSKNVSDSSVEFECNNFAGKLLVPKELLRTTHSVDEIFSFASNFSISGEVYLRRLFEEKKISKTIFFELLTLVRERSSGFGKKKNKQDGGPSMIVQSKSVRGNKFFNVVTDAALSGRLSYSAASDLLGLKVGSIRK
jgi:Zn-dependent peptidase ImmA (M78 family)